MTSSTPSDADDDGAGGRGTCAKPSASRGGGPAPSSSAAAPSSAAPSDASSGGDAPPPLPAAALAPAVPVNAHPERQPKLPPEQRAARRAALAGARRALGGLPMGEVFEVAGRPSLMWELRDYSSPYGELDRKLGIRTARADLPFLFRAFEAGQAPPPRPGTRAALEARAATIHEYLDWTLSAEDALEDDELDFGGFRAVVLSPRFKPAWPPPGAYERDGAPPSVPGLGAPRPPRPTLLPTGKPICAATVRSSLGYLEVPFFATQEARRNRGYGRALVECLDALARALSLPTILLCSTDDPVTRGTWTSLGFARTSDAELKEFGVLPGDLLHMDNTVQMHRRVPPAPPLRSVVIKHGAFSQRCWYLPGAGPAARDAVAAAGRKRAAAAAAKPPPKKRAAVKPSGR